MGSSGNPESKKVGISWGQFFYFSRLPPAFRRLPPAKTASYYFRRLPPAFRRGRDVNSSIPVRRGPFWSTPFIAQEIRNAQARRGGVAAGVLGAALGGPRAPPEALGATALGAARDTGQEGPLD